MGIICSTPVKDEKCIQRSGKKAERKNNQETTSVDGMIILKWILNKYDGTVGTGFIWLRTRSNGGLF
jgi:hypothetical protein